MKGQYNYQAAAMYKKLQQVENELDRLITIAADNIFSNATHETATIALSDYGVRVGAFETLIDGYPLVEAIMLEEGTISLKPELVEDFEPLSSFTTLTLYDKVAILEALENIIKENKD
jgi:hypothetical protein